ncbi:MAG: DUF1786 domain-containing protein [Anaerolineaceae bacterium]|nr:DUF1786 domain-containing protein [Anaerolineaceae bacterium]
MKILLVDIGTGTQDILLFDSRHDVENGYKLVLPSPTMIINNRIRLATHDQRPIVLTGVTMGGGPTSWATENHIQAGLPVYATQDAARTFNDDLDLVRKMGVQIIADDEIIQLPKETLRLELKDFDFELIRTTFEHFGVSLDTLAAVAVAVFDHGAAPTNVSDRQFRFDYLDARIRAENRLSAFAYTIDRIPKIMTRLQVVAETAINVPAPIVVMDTAPAAVLGANLDPIVMNRSRKLIANIGNFHTLAFRLGPEGIEGVFEHHTGLVDKASLEHYLKALADGSLRNIDIFNTQGHGALVYSNNPLVLDRNDYNVTVTGPRRNLIQGSSLKPYFASPFGDMMIAGCFGLLAATADVLPDLREEIVSSLHGQSGRGTPPWEAID